MNIIEFNSVSKYYGKKNSKSLGIENISFNVKKASVVGLIGPNGAGKSTSVKLISGILKEDEGSIRVMGKNPLKERKSLCKDMGIMFGNRSSLWYNIPAIESVKLMRDIYRIPKDLFRKRLDMYSEILDLEDILYKEVRKLSLGQRMKLELLVTLLHGPELIILDEPSIGLDIVAKQNLREIILDLSAKENKTILLTTHDLADVEKVCDQIILINKGNKILDLNSRDFNSMISQYGVVYLEKNRDMDIGQFRPYLREETPHYYKFILEEVKLKAFIDQLLNKFTSDIKFRVEKPSLEDIVYGSYN